MEFISSDIDKYILEHTSDANEVLEEIERNTYLRSIYPRMVSGKLQGRFLSLISKMIRPNAILEIGTFTGYSAICLAEGLAEKGILHTIEINDELKKQNQSHFEKAGLSEKIVPHFGNALDVIPKLGILFDLIFIDADKINYSNYFQLGMNVLKQGGFILADNVLWSGKVVHESLKSNDKDTVAVKEFNDTVQKDKRIENVMIPLRDGMTLIRKL